jgi:hypothetical protein
MKVKPEYMTEFGESLDCVIIGGYYGSGRRGGRLSSFLCGLRVDKNQIQKGANPMKCYSFFKVFTHSLRPSYRLKFWSNYPVFTVYRSVVASKLMTMPIYAITLKINGWSGTQKIHRTNSSNLGVEISSMNAQMSG